MKTLDALSILYVGTFPPHPGGSAVSAVQLLDAFTKLGHRVRAVSPIARSEAGAKTPHPSYPDIAVRYFTMPQADVAVYRPPPPGYREVERDHIRRIVPELIRQETPDLILVGRESFVLHTLPIAREFDLPAVVRIAGGMMVGIEKNLIPAELAREICAEFRKANLLITPGRFLAEQLRGRHVDNVQVIYNAVNLELFRPLPRSPELVRELNVAPQDQVVAIVANLHGRKRPLDVVASAKQALKECPHLLYVFVGQGSLSNDVKNVARELGILDRIRLTGWQSYERIPLYMNLADIVVLPSFGEGLARVYLEAQACGRLMIASDIPPAKEVIRHEETGLLFPLGDPDALASNTVRAATDHELRARIEKNALQQAQGFDMPGAARRYVEAFHQIVAQHRTGARGV